MNNLSRKKTMLIVLLAAVLLISIGFAAFTSILKISPSASFTATPDSFRIKFSKESNSIKDGTNNPIVPISGNGENAIITNGTVPTVTGLKANFVNPGESVVYEFYAVNQTGYDAYLTNIIYNNIEGKSVIKECIPGEGATDKLVTQACAGINLKVQVEGMEQVGSTTTVNNHKLEKNTSEKITMTIEYNGSPVDGPLTITFGDISFIYSTADDGSGNLPGGGTTSKACTLVDANNNNEADTGEMVTCGTESFYVIPNDPVAHPGSSGKISMLAAQNIEISTDKPKQSDSAGITAFATYDSSGDFYWMTAGMGNEYGIFIYNDNALISQYVNAYKDTLKGIGLSDNITTTLISLSQLSSTELGCPSTGYGLCTGPSWVYDRDYWTGALSYGPNVHDITTQDERWHIYDSTPASAYSGIRPVVILSEDEIEFVGLAPGLYDENNNLVATFEELKSKYNIDIEEDDNSYSGYQQFYEDGVLSSVNKIIIPDGITKIGAGVFVLSDIESITIPSSVESIGDYAFWQSYISEVKMKEGLKTIGTGAFEDCMNLTSIKIPPSVTSIGSSAFGWSSVTTIYYKGTATGAPWGATDATVISDY